MTGLQRILKAYGTMTVSGVLWAWDYAKDEPRKRSDFTVDEWNASERSEGPTKEDGTPAKPGAAAF
jgi:hypothetical protein